MIVVHHLRDSRSQRILRLLEELIRHVLCLLLAGTALTV